MAKFLIFSDLHAHNYKSFNVGNSRLENITGVIEYAFEFAKAKGAKTLLFPGDLYDAQKAIPTIVITAVIKTFKKMFLKHPDMDFIAISGNHDYGSKNLFGKEPISALTHLVEVFPDNFILIDNGFIEYDDVTIYGIPYYEYSEHYDQALRKLCEESVDDKKHKILLIHQTPDGISNTSFAFDTDPNDPLYDNFDMIFCGHIHERQKLTPKFLVVGSPIHRDQGDIGEDKGFTYYGSDIDTLGFHILNDKYPTFERVETLEDVDPNNYNILAQTVVEVENSDNINVEEFNTDLKPTELLTNYWSEVDGEDKDLLNVGLSFLN